MPKIRLFDFETQGLEPEHKVCEHGWTDIEHDGQGWVIGATTSTLHFVDHMPPPARAVHHISAAMTQGFPEFSPALFWGGAKLDGVDVVAAHNLAFDAAQIGEPQLPMICTLKSARRLWPDAPSHGNGALRYWLQDQGLIDPDLARCEPSHRAGPDTYVTAHLLVTMLGLTTAAQLAAWTREPLVFTRWSFGKHRGVALTDTPADYLQWVATKSELDADTKWNAQRELDRRNAR